MLGLNTMLVFLAKLSSSVAFNANYYANNEYFPVIFRSRIFAITNVSARLASSACPLVAELMPNPCITVVILAIIAFVSSMFIKEDKN